MEQKNQTIHFGRLSVFISGDERESTYRFEGALDESFDFSQVPLLPSTVIHFQLEKIQSISSLGVRAWIEFVKTFSEVPRMEFHQVPISVWDQATSVPSIFGNGVVVSFFAPFYCPHCSKEVSACVVALEHKSSLLLRRAPVIKHATCGHVMEFDAFEESYFCKTADYCF
jgi:hypothetical protein